MVVSERQTAEQKIDGSFEGCPGLPTALNPEVLCLEKVSKKRCGIGWGRDSIICQHLLRKANRRGWRGGGR